MELAVHPEEETDIVIGECLTRDEAQDIISVLVRDGAVQGEDSVSRNIIGFWLCQERKEWQSMSVCLSWSKIVF